MDRKENKITFLFGAGAEDCFGMPMGNEYTLKTILAKRTKMLEELEKFYKKRQSENVEKYYKQNLFQKDSHTFREIIKRAIELLTKEEKQNCTEEDKRLIELYNNKNSEKEVYEIINEIFESVYFDLDNEKNSEKEENKYDTIMRKINYYGSVEKDFSTIINPNEAGIKRFSRLINYFWGAYFTIIIPVLDLTARYNNNKNYNENKYKYILDNLIEITKYIYSDEFYVDIEEKYKKSYYLKLSEAFANSSIATTNYTPFLRFSKFKEKIYLSGELSQFEVLDELRITNINNEKEVINKFIFPYLATQAPIKPIIDEIQLNEYKRFIDMLNEMDILVIIGYSMNENDSHINTLLRQFINKKSTNRLVVYQFLYKDEELCDKTKEVYNNLRLYKEEMKQQVVMLENDGTIDKLIAYFNK